MERICRTYGRVLLACGIVAILGSACIEDDDPCSDPLAPACGSTYEPSSATLNLTPIAQQTEVWCWAAAAEMVFRYYGLPNVNSASNYQCGVVAAYAYILAGTAHQCFYNCSLCIEPISTLTELKRVVDLYGQVALQAGFQSRVLKSRAFFGPLTLPQLARELDEGRPIIAGISFNGLRLPNISQHAVVIVGYDARGPEPILFVNDPFPYTLIVPPAQNPYLIVGGTLVAPGRYAISLSGFTNNLVWANTIYDIR